MFWADFLKLPAPRCMKIWQDGQIYYELRQRNGIYAIERPPFNFALWHYVTFCNIQINSIKLWTKLWHLRFPSNLNIAWCPFFVGHFGNHLSIFSAHSLSLLSSSTTPFPLPPTPKPIPSHLKSLSSSFFWFSFFPFRFSVHFIYITEGTKQIKMNRGIDTLLLNYTRANLFRFSLTLTSLCAY